MLFLNEICRYVPSGSDPYSQSIRKDDIVGAGFLWSQPDGLISEMDLYLNKYGRSVPKISGLRCDLYGIELQVRKWLLNPAKHPDYMIEEIEAQCRTIKNTYFYNSPWSQNWLVEFCKTQTDLISNSQSN